MTNLIITYLFTATKDMAEKPNAPGMGFSAVSAFLLLVWD